LGKGVGSGEKAVGKKGRHLPKKKGLAMNPRHQLRKGGGKGNLEGRRGGDWGGGETLGAKKKVPDSGKLKSANSKFAEGPRGGGRDAKLRRTRFERKILIAGYVLSRTKTPQPPPPTNLTGKKKKVTRKLAPPEERKRCQKKFGDARILGKGRRMDEEGKKVWQIKNQ